MATAEIRETIVTPDGHGTVVQLQIADVALPTEDAGILLRLYVRLPGYEAPLLAQMQRAAMETARDALSALLQQHAKEIPASWP